MNDNKNETPISTQEIDNLLENFKSSIENNLGSNSGEFNRLMMPAPIVTEDVDIVSEISVTNPTTERRVKFNPYEVKIDSSPNENPVKSAPYQIAPTVPQPQIESEPEEETDFLEVNAPSDKPKLANPIFNFIKVIVFMALLAVTSWLLSSGNKMSLNTETAATRDGMAIFNSSAANLFSDSMNEIHNIPKVYLLEQNDEPAPIPNKNNFTKIDDNERKNYDGSPIYYYKDETIEVKCWKEEIDGLIVNFTEVKIAHPSQFRRKLVDNVISNKHLDYPLNIFRSVNGVVGMTSDYCAFRSMGTIVQYGKTVRSNLKGNLDILIYDDEGNLSSMTNRDFEKSELYGSEKVVYTFAFGPVLVDNYEIYTGRRAKNNPKRVSYPIGEVNQNYPRAAIGQFGYDKHYLLCAVDYRSKEMPGTNITRVAEIMQEKGCRFVYNMDGGQTSTMMFNGNVFNEVAYGGQREVSDIMYFATAIPNE